MRTAAAAPPIPVYIIVLSLLEAFAEFAPPSSVDSVVVGASVDISGAGVGASVDVSGADDIGRERFGIVVVPAIVIFHSVVVLA